MSFTLKQLRYFATVAELGSISRSTQRLNVSQPSISAAIAHLEDVFGVDLFVRHHAKGLSLTPAGRRFLAASKRVLTETDSLGQFAAELSAEVSGPVEVGCILTLAPLLLPSMVASFTALHPATTINHHELAHHALLTGLQSGRLEIAITYDLDIPDELVFVTIAEFAPYAIVPVGHRLQERGSAHLRELSHEPMILLDLPHTGDYFRGIFKQLGIVPNIVHQTPSPNMVRSLVANGFGYSLLNAPLRNDRAMDGTPLRRLTLNDAIPPLNLGLVTQRDHRPTRTAAEFLHHLKTTIAI